MVRIKHDVDLRRIQAPMAVALVVAASVYSELGNVDTLVTSGAEGQHMAGSLHYVGLALDLRLPSPATVARVVALLKDALGPQYDVVLEKDHIHVEFDPKTTTGIK